MIKIYIDEICPTCGKVFAPTAYQRWNKKKNGSILYCCAHCYHVSKKGDGNPNWRGGRSITDGYIHIYQPDHPEATKKGYVCEHRLIIEEELGRYLTKEESVHHINGNTLDNTPENLTLQEDESEHRKLHSKYRTRDKNGRFEGHIIVERME